MQKISALSAFSAMSYCGELKSYINKMSDSIAIVLVVFVVSLFAILAARQVNPFHPPATHRERLRRAITVGLLTGGGLLSMLLIADLVGDSGFQLNLTSLAILWLCLILPFQVLATIGTYVEFIWQEKILHYLVRLAERSSEREKKR